ncbi:Sec20-domain-containing protein [Absidia repens]|uniref:Sec20-domain-containing protein n=1 Tax=Absidia repens TaxID=90262 RepID=A0A1X2IX00_9FUNG|nr:Sec20-domain-containing protein [Absidia repens]
MDAKFRSLSKQAADCQRLIYRINNVDSLAVQEEVASLIRNDVRRLEKDIQSVKLLADEEDRQATKNQILNRLGEYETQYRQLQITSRQAILKSKQRIQQKEQETREALFGNKRTDGGHNFTEEYELRQRNSRGNDESLLRATSSVTEALQRTSTLMQQELEKSSYSASTLAESSKTLSGTLSEYDNLGSLLTISKRMITHLETSDWFDRLVLLFGVIVFSLVVLYIIKKRTYDVGKSWISWMGSAVIEKKSTSLTISATMESPLAPSSMPMSSLVSSSSSLDVVEPTLSSLIPSPSPTSLVVESLSSSSTSSVLDSISSSSPTSLAVDSLFSSSHTTATLVSTPLDSVSSVIHTWRDEL